MNKKNKNKNRSKPTNPAPAPQIAEPAKVIEEVVTAVVEETPICVVQVSDSVDEITSEAMETVQENDENPTDTPKKPKRNKAKKKKQEEASSDEKKTDLVQDSAPVASIDSEVKVENIVETKESKDEEEDKKLEVTANVRKKKNKRKQNEPQKVEEPCEKIETAVKVQETIKNKENVMEALLKPDVDIQDTMQSDTKQAKKKNKKKKHRHDSEKSDKAEDAHICTAAFQQLISSTNNEGDINSGTTIKSSQDSGERDLNLSTSDKEETLRDLIQSVLLPDESKQSEDDVVQHDQMNETKNKKKAKKDKKQKQCKVDDEKITLTKEDKLQEKPSEVSSDIAQELTSNEQVECVSKDSKAKAKIAKPVEKKRRGKMTESIEDRENKTKEDIISHALNIDEPVIEIGKIDVPHSQQIYSSVSSSNISSKKIEEEESTEVMQATKVVLSSENSASIIISPDTISSTSENPDKAIDLNLADINIGMKSDAQICKSIVETQDTVVLKSDKNSENNASELLFPLEVPDGKDSDIPSSSVLYKTVEKKKKKHPKKVDVSCDKTLDDKVLLTPELEIIKEGTPQMQIENTSLGLTNLENVEISSLKTDELDSSDVTPDFVHHPLATSQQLIDDNNNMVIREITSTDEKLTLDLLISSELIIQDSGETPEPLGEKIPIVSSRLTSTRERSVTNEPEKTDLKSKMMEVSQDMEELRLSIERSLAELTSMEKSEPEVSKKIEEIESSQTITETPQQFCNVGVDMSDNNKSKLLESKSRVEDSAETREFMTQKSEALPKSENIQEKNKEVLVSAKSDEKQIDLNETQPQAPARKDHKGKGKGKKKGKQETHNQQTTSGSETVAVTNTENTTREVKKEEKEQSEQKSQSSEHKGKQQQDIESETDSRESEKVSHDPTSNINEASFEPIENFEDALTSSVDDVNKTFEMIANEVNNPSEFVLQNPQIDITSPTEDTETAEPKQNPVSPPKNLLGHPDIPVPSSRADYKKEKNKPPNMRQAKVKIKDAVDIEKTKQSKESQTENKKRNANNRNVLESFSYMTNESAEYVYKYSFRKVFLQSLCHVCRKELGQRVPCQFCSLVFYCSQKHKDEDWPQHQSLCFAICTIAHLKEQKHIYGDAQDITGQNYRLLRMQMIVSCEKVLKRKLVPWEQEALLYPRMCADVACREWKQSKLADCEGCGQMSYCSEDQSHLSSSHQRWCRSYALYQKLVHHQQTTGRLEPKLPTRIVAEGYRIPEKINEVLAAMYDEKIDMNDMEYAALTQLATAPLTAAYCHQLATANHSNGISKKTSFVIHIVGAELQFEADVLFKWELFFLHLKPHVKELRVVLVSPDLNPSNLPLHLLEKVNVCDSCRAAKRRVLFNFQDKKTYYEYWTSDEFFSPDIVCAFNPSIQRSSIYNGKDTWPTAISCILKLKAPLVVSSYSIEELNRDVARIKECSDLSGVGFKTLSNSTCNPFASVRPDRNFITDDEVPLLFKNYCFVVLCGV